MSLSHPGEIPSGERSEFSVLQYRSSEPGTRKVVPEITPFSPLEPLELDDLKLETVARIDEKRPVPRIQLDAVAHGPERPPSPEAVPPPQVGDAPSDTVVVLEEGRLQSVEQVAEPDSTFPDFDENEAGFERFLAGPPPDLAAVIRSQVAEAYDLDPERLDGRSGKMTDPKVKTARCVMTHLLREIAGYSPSKIADRLSISPDGASKRRELMKALFASNPELRGEVALLTTSIRAMAPEASFVSLANVDEPVVLTQELPAEQSASEVTTVAQVLEAIPPLELSVALDLLFRIVAEEIATVYRLELSQVLHPKSLSRSSPPRDREVRDLLTYLTRALGGYTMRTFAVRVSLYFTSISKREKELNVLLQQDPTLATRIETIQTAVRARFAKPSLPSIIVEDPDPTSEPLAVVLDRFSQAIVEIAPQAAAWAELQHNLAAREGQLSPPILQAQPMAAPSVSPTQDPSDSLLRPDRDYATEISPPSEASEPVPNPPKPPSEWAQSILDYLHAEKITAPDASLYVLTIAGDCSVEQAVTMIGQPASQIDKLTAQLDRLIKEFLESESWRRGMAIVFDHIRLNGHGVMAKETPLTPPVALMRILTALDVSFVQLFDPFNHDLPVAQARAVASFVLHRELQAEPLTIARLLGHHDAGRALEDIRISQGRYEKPYYRTLIEQVMEAVRAPVATGSLIRGNGKREADNGEADLDRPLASLDEKRLTLSEFVAQFRAHIKAGPRALDPKEEEQLSPFKSRLGPKQQHLLVVTQGGTGLNHDGQRIGTVEYWVNRFRHYGLRAEHFGVLEKKLRQDKVKIDEAIQLRPAGETRRIPIWTDEHAYSLLNNISLGRLR